MNLRHPKLILAVRVLLGLFILFSGVSGLAAGSSMEGIPEPMVPVMKVLWQTGIFHMIKVTEAVAGLMLVVGFLPALALLFLAPICVGVIVFNGAMSPQYLPAGIIVSVLTAYLGYAYWDKYKAIFERK